MTIKTILAATAISLTASVAVAGNLDPAPIDPPVAAPTAPATASDGILVPILALIFLASILAD